MGHIFLTDMARRFRDAGLKVVEYDGWETRARSSGGYDQMPLAVFWHHTASDGPVSDDANYECHVADAKPIANVTIERDGTVWVLAAGATNTNGSGNAQSFSRGTVPADGANARVFGMEISNMGTGAEPYPAAQIDACFGVSNVINAWSGNRPDDVMTHQVYAPSRKVDPATAAAVQGSFDPDSTTSSGTWSLPDLKAECNRRANGAPPDPGGDDMPLSQEDVDRVAWQVWSIVLNNGYSTATNLMTAASAPATTINYPIPVDGAYADFWSLIVDTRARVMALQEASGRDAATADLTSSEPLDPPEVVDA